VSTQAGRCSVKMGKPSCEAALIAPNPATLSTNLRGLLPDGVVVAELRGEGDPNLLMPVESSYLGRSVPKRAREFAAGRLCARRALAEFGILNFPLEVGADRRPLWPPSVIGSITHTDGFCAAAVAACGQMAAVGIDSEAATGVKPELWESICVEAEIAWLGTLAEQERVSAATLIFSAKEAFYKCQYPLTAQSLGFHDATVRISGWGRQRATFTITTSPNIAFAKWSASPMSGHYLFHDEFVTAALCLPCEAGARARGPGRDGQ
jgi:4'-phosphopantetheinyl transferase EntD